MRGAVADGALGEVAAVDQDVGAGCQRPLDGREIAGVAAQHGGAVERRRAEIELSLAAMREDVDVAHVLVRGEVGRDRVDAVLARIEQHDLRGMIDVLDQRRDVGDVGLDEDHAFRRRRARGGAEIAGAEIQTPQGAGRARSVRARQTVRRGRIAMRESLPGDIDACMLCIVRRDPRMDRLGSRCRRGAVERDAPLQRDDGEGGSPGVARRRDRRTFAHGRCRSGIVVKARKGWSTKL